VLYGQVLIDFNDLKINFLELEKLDEGI